MAITVSFTANNVSELRNNLIGFLSSIKGTELVPLDTPPAVPTEEYPQTPVQEVIEPVITQDRMEENMANAPVHEMPAQPTIEEVRAVLKDLRARKGAGAVKALLAEYGADSLPNLKEEDYLVVRDRAIAEV